MLESRIEPLGSEVLGKPAGDIYRAILAVNPEIEWCSVRIFDPNSVYSNDWKDENDGQVMWLDRKSLLNLGAIERLGELIFNSSREWLSTYEGEDYYAVLGLAVGSVLILNNDNQQHIPMLDFWGGEEPDIDELCSVLKPLRGVLIETDHSYHFWGQQLMTNDHWRVWLEDVGGRLSTIDQDFVLRSLRVGFSALRVQGFPGTLRAQIPKVMGLVNYDVEKGE